MPEAAIDRPLQLQVSPPLMRKLEITRKTFEQDDIEGLSFNFRFSYARVAPNQIGVEMQVESSDHSLVSFSVAWRAEFRVGTSAEDGVDYDEIIKGVAAHNAPVVLYPFIRETVMNASLKMGIDPIVLPIVNFGSLINPDELEIPPFRLKTAETQQAEPSKKTSSAKRKKKSS